MTEEHRQVLRKALALLDRADTLGVPTRAIHLRRARYYSRLGEEGSAAEQKSLAQRSVPTTDLDHFLVGLEHYSQGDRELPQAIREFRQAVEINGKHFWASYFLGICYVMSDEPEAAVASFTTCQCLEPDLVWIYLMRGFARGQMEEHASAESDFERAERALELRLDPAARYVFYTNRG
jgi:tetratricopeptide (TPR) repeat protein